MLSIEKHFFDTRPTADKFSFNDFRSSFFVSFR